MDSASAKQEFAIALLQESSVFVHLDPRREGVIVPGWLKKQPQLVLQVGLNLAVRIPDLDIGELAICCTLSFNRSPFFCRVPWSSVFGLVGEDGRGRIWPEDVPLEIAAQMQQQASKEATKEAAKAQRQQGRARLQAIPSPEAAAARESSASESPQSTAEVTDARAGSNGQPQIAVATDESAAPKPEARPNAGKSVRPSAPPGAKRELPSYLRVVK
jgi:hypothetical protein